MSIFLLHFGNNKYPRGNTLYKCVNDAIAMAKLFGTPKAGVLVDGMNTRANMIKAFTQVVKAAGPGDKVVVSYSGHGTQVKDRNGDEPDGWDEAIVPIDLTTIIDDLIYSILTQLNPQAQGFLFSDSCFSGTIQRAMPGVSSAHVGKLRQRKVRYIPSTMVKETRSPVGNKGPQDPVANWVVFGGCSDFEFSYEGPKNGVMTDGIMQTAKKGITVQDLYDKMAVYVAKQGYNQHPQLSCTPASSKWIVPFI